MKEIEAKRKGKKPPTNVPYPEGVRRNRVQMLDPDSFVNDLEEDKRLLSSGMWVYVVFFQHMISVYIDLKARLD